MLTDLYFMNLAKELALKSKGKTFPNPLVGAVIVKDKKIIGLGYHQKAGGPHAEILALRQAKEKAKGARLYVTLEPCSHFGRTPPCVDAILKSGLKEVIIGMKDPNPLNNGKSMKILKKNGIKVRAGFLKEELMKINEPFMKYITKKMPFVTIKVGQSLDGKIATKTGDAQWITAEKTRLFTHRLRRNYDAILVGINTVLKDNPGLNCQGKAIKKIIVDSHLRLPINAKIFHKTDPSIIIIAITKFAPVDIIKRFRIKGVVVLVVGKKNKQIDLKVLLKELAKLGISNVLVEGGGEINAALLKERLADKISFFIAPKIIGGNQAINSFGGEGIKFMRQAIELQDVEVKRINHDLWVEGKVVYGNH
ncbi:MAG: bifunctional diaminohydroxyphosphoribosylaminopyrimidine deaminase/5-amino-6-(5-phosphoribosylamino)uracil reductase RibD [Candidatus Omnitrophota bacterium]|nr:bifunctional diaminohydroxyphosphoribosylaminopyrimidine deaminase/5-amino-6-(5-phosphoribosylamino)uracil reductase RibD [Candidatus Omnitrophota bacterium]